MRTIAAAGDDGSRRALLRILVSAGLALTGCGSAAEAQLERGGPAPAAGTAQLDAAVSGQWSPAITWPQSAVHTHLLPTGTVLFTSEFANGDDPRIWDPATDTITAAPGVDYNPFCAGHTFLADGR